MTFILAPSRVAHPNLPYAEISNAILGRSYDVTLVFVGRTRAQRLNQTYRQKNYTPNVLSFPLDEKTGEIYICGEIAKAQAPLYEHSYQQHVGYLFIHGCLHLKGHDHGDTMEKLEQRYMRRFNITSL